MSSAREWFIRKPGPNRFRVSGETVRRTEEVMAKTARGECLECERLADGEDGLCVFCRRAAKES